MKIPSEFIFLNSGRAVKNDQAINFFFFFEEGKCSNDMILLIS